MTNYSVVLQQWLEEHQFLECLIQIVCGTYVAEELAPVQFDAPEKAERESSEKTDANHKDNTDSTDNTGGSDADAEKGKGTPIYYELHVFMTWFIVVSTFFCLWLTNYEKL